MAAAEILGRNIRFLRKRQDNLSQEAFADLAKINRGHVSDLELGKHNPQLDTIERIAAALHVLPHELLDPELRSKIEGRK